MISAQTLVKAFIISVLIALALTFSSLLLYSSGRVYDPDINWQEVESMSYDEAMTHIDAHSKEASRWEILKTSIEFKSFLEPYFYLSIVIIFVFLLIFNKWVRNGHTT